MDIAESIEQGIKIMTPKERAEKIKTKLNELTGNALYPVEWINFIVSQFEESEKNISLFYEPPNEWFKNKYQEAYSKGFRAAQEKQGGGEMKIKQEYTKAQEAIWQKGFEQGCIQLSEHLDEHPETWNGPCWCQLCQSYGEES